MADRRVPSLNIGAADVSEISHAALKRDTSKPGHGKNNRSADGIRAGEDG